MRRNKSDDRKMNGLAFRQVRNFCKTRPLYEKADNPNARLIRAVALRSGRLRPIGFPLGGSCPHLRTDEGVMFPSSVLT